VICVSVSFYALAKQHGAEGARKLVLDQLNATDAESLPAIRTVAMLRELQDCRMWPDFGGAAVGKMRSRAAHAAWTSGADTWVSCDDDVEATGETVRALVEAVSGDDPAVCIAPCLLREADVVNVGVELDAAIPVRMLPSGGQAVACLGGGFGLVAVNRAALERIREAQKHLAFVDDDGEEKLALFVEEIADGRWWGEDLSFFKRMPPGVRVECLIQGATAHEGQILDLSSLPDQKHLDLSGWRAATRPAAERIEVTATPVPDPAAEGSNP